MSTAEVGFLFALLCAVREWWRWYRPRSVGRREAAATCAAIGHDWQGPIETTRGDVMWCRRCNVQADR